MQEEVKAAAEEAVRTVRKLAELTGAYAFSWRPHRLYTREPEFDLQMNAENLYRFCSHIEYEKIPKHEGKYLASGKVGGIEFFTVLEEHELPKDVKIA